MVKIIEEEQFSILLKLKLGEQYERALNIFTNYGKNLSWDVVNVLLHAAAKEKIEEVLSELEKHWETHLQYQHPDIRGTVEDKPLGVNKTQAMFLQICENILQLQPVAG